MKQYKPVTPGLRHAVKEDFGILTKKKSEKRLLLRLKRRAGRAKSGRITVRHKGGGEKRFYRIVDFGQEKFNIKGKVIALEYDPYRTAFLILLQYDDGEKRYRLAPQNIKIGDEIICAEVAEIKPGNRIKMKNIPVGTMIHDIEIESKKGGKLARGAGAAARVLAQEGGFIHLEMPSGEIRRLSRDCFATIGVVSRPEHKYIERGKAGISRHLGIRPTVRGAAMNPPDHPHGGGEGKTPIGMPGPKTPWGKPARGVKTRKRKWTDKYIIKRRNKK